jgi:hypothetical protein
MYREPDRSHSFHFHIHWSQKERVDWESFSTHAEATARALELARPSEIFTIEEFSATCPACGSKAASAS